jgi:hypothetical protein
MIITAIAICTWGHSQHGWPGICAGAIAVGIVWTSAAGALAINVLLAGTPQAVNGQMGGILLKTMLPLAMGMLLQQNIPWLREANVFGMMVPAYLVSLVVVTILLVRLVGFVQPGVKAKAL